MMELIETLQTKDYWFVVEPQEYNLYRDQYGEDHVVILPANGKGLAFSRDWILHELPYIDGVHDQDWFWMIDDDIFDLAMQVEGKMRNHNKSNPKPYTNREIVNWLEALYLHRPQVAVGGVYNGGRCWLAKRAWTLNIKVIQMLCISRARLGEVHFDEGMKLLEDVDFCAQVVQSGSDILRVDNISTDAPDSGGNAGGLGNYAGTPLEHEMVQRLAEKYPTVCKPAVDKRSRPITRFRISKLGTQYSGEYYTEAIRNAPQLKDFKDL